MHSRRVVASERGTQAESWSREFICLGDHDPGTLGIDVQTLSGRGQDFDGIFRSLRLAWREGGDDFLLPVAVLNRYEAGAARDSVSLCAPFQK